MALTDHCDLFVAVEETGVHSLVRNLMRQRPSLFNYGTGLFTRSPDALCHPIEVTESVEKAENPRFTEVGPLPILGAPPLGLEWCLQITDLEVDFHPEGTITLPKELSPLDPQRVGLRMRACFGLDCPDGDVIQDTVPRIETEIAKEWRAAEQEESERERGKGHEEEAAVPGGPLLPKEGEPVWPLPTREVECFCFEAFAELHLEWKDITVDGAAEPWLVARLDGFEIVDIDPPALESQVECYVRTVLELGILPRLVQPRDTLVLDILGFVGKQKEDMGFSTFELRPTDTSDEVPFNPSVSDDRLSAKMELVIELEED